MNPNTIFTHLPYSASQILESLADGVYVTDRQRRILYWNPAASRITGWPAEEMVGRFCHDNLLRHKDTNGTPLCGEESCPLHRAMATDQASTAPQLVVATGRNGQKIPVQVSVAPIHDPQGEVIGGVEIFREVSDQFRDLERAKAIQAAAMRMPDRHDPRISFAVQRLSHEMVGGDFYTVEPLDAHRYVFCVADVMGHGVAAGLYAMHLHSLWESNRRFLAHPATFVTAVNRSLCQLLLDGESFATMIYGVIDLSARALTLVSAGAPPLLLAVESEIRQLQLSGLPLGVDQEHIYEVCLLPVAPGDGLLFCTDGAMEITNQEGRQLGADGLAKMVAEQGFPVSKADLAKLSTRLLRWSRCLRLPDDCTMLSIQLLDSKSSNEAAPPLGGHHDPSPSS